MPLPLPPRAIKIAALKAEEDKIDWNDELCESLCQRIETEDITFAALAKEMKVRPKTIESKVRAAEKKRKQLEEDQQQAARTDRTIEAIQREREKNLKATRAYEAYRRGQGPE
jgi:hypothetical protein